MKIKNRVVSNKNYDNSIKTCKQKKKLKKECSE